MITGLIEPSEGLIMFHGEPIGSNRVAHRQRLGYVPEEPHLYPHLTGLEYLEMVAELRCLPRRPTWHKIHELLRLLSLSSNRHVPISSYSKGMRQKVLIAAALIHNPELVVLDEPFSGLDINTHEFEVVERLCSRVVILHKGKLVANDSVQNLGAVLSRPNLESIFSELVKEGDTAAITRDIVEVIKS